MKAHSKWLFWAVNLGHFTNDVFMSMRGVLLAFISMYVLPMSNRQIGLALSLGELTGAISQPVFGWLADRTGGRWLGAVGVAWTVSGIMLAMLIVSLGGGYWLMLIPLALAALGSGAFHPVGSMYATEIDRSRAARNAALFFMFGQLGLGLGPALAGLLLEGSHTANNLLFGTALGPAYQQVFLENGSVTPIFTLMLIAVPGVLMMALTLPSRRAYRHGSDSAAPMTPQAASAREPLPVRNLSLLGVAVTLRALSGIAIVSFIPLLFQLKGWSPSQYGLLASSFWVASGVSGVLFGYLGDRFDLRRVIAASLVIAAPGIFLLPALDGLLAFAMAIVVGAMSGSHSLIVVLAQSFLPGRKGFASGIILGFLFATGALGNLVVGDLIDRMGMVSAFHIMAGITLAGSLLWLGLPAPKARAVPASTPAAEPVASSAD